MDALSTLMRETWDVIVNDRDLNLPDQRVMAAKVRCKEIRDAATALVEEKVSAVKEMS